MWDYLRTRWQSLIFRLLFYFLVSMLALAIILTISFAKRLKPHVQNEILPNVERYIEYLIEDIGNPPNLAVAQRLANELPFEIRIEGQGLNWTSSPRLESVDSYEFDPAPPPYDNVYFSHHRRDEYLLIQKQGYQYLFAVDNSFRKGSERRHWILFLVVGAILSFLYLAIRRLFKPIEVISEQVRKIGQGDLEQAVENKGRGELALLANGINHMAAQIKTMLESKSGLLLAISHELRSPITRMRVNLELLDESEIQQKLVEDIREMESLVATILESEKLSAGHAPLNLACCQMLDLVDEVIRVHACRDRIKTSMSPVELKVDSLRFKLLLKNLIDNACHYSADNAELIEVSLQHDSERVTLEVSDRGIGIATDEIPHLTEAFYRPDSARQRNTGGYGLGLYLCKLITDAHGGKIVIESEPGKGTRVIVILPIDNS
jgi:signal transduction histidine kinase